jgi:small-conductance mechanosensitive channel
VLSAHLIFAGQSLWPFRWEDALTQKILWSLLGIVVIYGLAMLGAQLLNRALTDPLWRHKSRKLVYYTGTALAILVLLGIWSESLAQFAVGLGVLGAALALALQQVVLSLAGWFYIVTGRPYDVGDRIEIFNVAGDVIDIRVLKTVLLEIYTEGSGRGSQSTGRVVDFPNSYIFSHTLVNYTRGFEYLWNEYAIRITFESHWEKALRIVLEILEGETKGFELPAREQITQMARSYLIQYGHLTPAVYVTLRENGVELAMRYLTPARGRRQIRDRISKKILSAFAQEPDIELAYPTYRIFRRDQEEATLEQHPLERTPPPAS